MGNSSSALPNNFVWRPEKRLEESCDEKDILICPKHKEVCQNATQTKQVAPPILHFVSQTIQTVSRVPWDSRALFAYIYLFFFFTHASTSCTRFVLLHSFLFHVLNKSPSFLWCFAWKANNEVKMGLILRFDKQLQDSQGRCRTTQLKDNNICLSLLTMLHSRSHWISLLPPKGRKLDAPLTIAVLYTCTQYQMYRIRKKNTFPLFLL